MRLLPVGLALLALGATGIAPAIAKKPKQKTVAANKSVTLKSSDRKGAVKVRLAKFTDNLFIADEYSRARDGFRIVAVQLSMRNVGKRKLSGDVQSLTTVVTNTGESYDYTYRGPAECPGSNTTTVPRGQIRTACIAFEVPLGQAVKYVIFDPEFRTFAQWRL